MIWVISEVYYPDEAATSHFMTLIAEGLAKKAAVRVICAKPTLPNYSKSISWKEKYKGVSIRRCWGTTFNKNVYFLRLINSITISVSIFFRTLISIKKNDSVLVVTNPPSLPFVVALACKIRRAKCILRIDDVYPEALINAGLIKAQSFLARISHWFTKKLYQHVDQIIVLGRDMKRIVENKLQKTFHAKLKVITNWADLELVSPLPRLENPLLKELGLSSKFVVQYAGNMGPLQGLDSLIKAAIKLKDHPHIHFLFIGSGKMLPWLKEEISKEGLGNVTLLGQRPRSDQANFLNACDVAFVSLKAGMAGVGVPSRMYNVLAAGKPIIGVIEDHAELARVIREEKVGWIASPDNPDEIAKRILEASQDSKLLIEMGKRARNIAETKYSSQTIINAYSELF